MIFLFLFFSFSALFSPERLFLKFWAKKTSLTTKTPPFKTDHESGERDLKMWLISLLKRTDSLLLRTLTSLSRMSPFFAPLRRCSRFVVSSSREVSDRTNEWMISKRLFLWSSSLIRRCVRLKRLSVFWHEWISFSLTLSKSLLIKTLRNARQTPTKRASLSLERFFVRFCCCCCCCSFCARVLSARIFAFKIWRKFSLFFGAKNSRLVWKKTDDSRAFVAGRKKVLRITRECCDLSLSLSPEREREREQKERGGTRRAANNTREEKEKLWSSLRRASKALAVKRGGGKMFHQNEMREFSKTQHTTRERKKKREKRREQTKAKEYFWEEKNVSISIVDAKEEEEERRSSPDHHLLLFVLLLLSPPPPLFRVCLLLPVVFLLLLCLLLLPLPA